MADGLALSGGGSKARTIKMGDRCVYEGLGNGRRNTFCRALSSSRSDGTTDVRFERDRRALVVATRSLTVVPDRPKPDFE